MVVPRLLDITAIIVMLADKDVPTRLSTVRSTWLNSFPHSLVLGDTNNTQRGIEACCPANFGRTIETAQQKLEHAYSLAFDRFPNAKWFVFTEVSV